MKERDENAWTTTELAKAAGISRPRVRQLLLRGQLEGYKLARDWRIPDEEARRYLAERKARQ